jgi:succinate dehydrogenase/fumarate reductase flavoprotein subunit
VVGGGTAGTMAAITAAETGVSVLLLDKAHVRHSGALAMGMDGVNNAVIPGQATPEDYVAEITRANDGIINQRTVYQTASRGYEMVRRLEQYGVKFAKDAHGDYEVRRVHRSGSYVLPMPEGKDIKKVPYRVLRQRSIRERVRIENRVMPVRVLTAAGRAVGVAGFNTRTGEFVTVSAGAVILATGGHSFSGVWVDENAVTTVPGLYAAGDLACVPHNYMIGAFVFGDLAGAHASEFARGPAPDQRSRGRTAGPGAQLPAVLAPSSSANRCTIMSRPLSWATTSAGTRSALSGRCPAPPSGPTGTMMAAGGGW